MKLPTLAAYSLSRDMISTFGGYHHHSTVPDNSFFDMQNMSSDHYPALSVRKGRGNFEGEVTSPYAMIYTDRLCYVDGSDVVIGTERIECGLSTDFSMRPKRLVSMGIYLLVFPDHYYVNTVDTSDHGPISVSYNGGEIYTLEACDKDGEPLEHGFFSHPLAYPSYLDYPGYFKLTIREAQMKGVGFCVGSVLTPKATSSYTELPSVPGIPTGYFPSTKENIYVDGILTGSTTLYAVQYYKISEAYVYSVSEDTIVFYGTCKRSRSDYVFDEEPEAKRYSLRLTGDPIPQMDHVFEHENRLWGCRYGKNAFGEQVNEIYASALGSFRNWNLFEGTANDAFVQGIGSDGPFTGACSYNGYPYFFKERCYHKVYGSYPAEYRVQAVECKGVQNGSSGSMVAMNGLLYYKAIDAVCSFDGSYPTDISYSLGDRRYANAVGGSHRYKYYLSMKDVDTGEWSFFVYDALYGLWHKEDELRAACFCDTMHALYCISVYQNRILNLTGGDADVETEIPWSFETGMIAAETVDRKFLQSISARLSLSIGGTLFAFIEYDSSGQWEYLFRLAGSSTNTFTIPITPQRCDHFRLKFSGTGDMKLFALAKAYTKGSAY